MDETEPLVDLAQFQKVRAELGASLVRILGYFREDGEKSVTAIEAAMHRKDAAGLILPAHTMKTEARQFGAEPLGALAEAIEDAGRRGVESRLFPDQILPQVARLRPIYQETMALLDKETNPLVARRPAFGRAPANQEFGRI